MADQKKIAVIVLVVILGIVGVVYFTKNSAVPRNAELPQATAVEQERFGLVDMDQVIAAHPHYEQLEKLKKERNTLMLSMEKTRQAGVDASPPAIDFSAIDRLMNQEKTEKMKAKLQELNGVLQKQELVFREAHQPAYEAALKDIDGQYTHKIFNLELKLKTLQVSPEAATEIQGQIDKLKAEQMQKMQEQQQQFFVKISGLMQEAQAKAKQELDAYSAAVDAELLEKARKQVDEQQSRNHLAMAEKSNGLQLDLNNVGNKQAELEDKEKEIAVLEEKIVGEIVAKVGQIAEENKLSVVLAQVQVNINAQDITPLVVKAFKS